MRNWRHQVTFASCMFILGSLGIPAMAQEQASLQPASLRTKDEAAPAPKPKPKKVWTEDSIAEVRTPADNYQDSKAAQSSAQATPVDAAAASNQTGHKGLGAPPIVLTIPKTAEETQKAIDQRKGMSENFHNLLSNAQERLETETNPMVRATLQEKANLLLGDISSTNSEIKALEKALEDYKNGKAPAQPKTDGPASASDSAKPAVQSAASNTPQ